MPMIWAVEKKVFYHILDMGFESVGIPIRVKFEFEIQDGALLPDSLCFESLYNQRAIANRYPGVKKQILEREIQKTVEREIQNYLQNCGYISENT
jgi:hypothetical protein